MFLNTVSFVPNIRFRTSAGTAFLSGTDPVNLIDTGTPNQFVCCKYSNAIYIVTRQYMNRYRDANAEIRKQKGVDQPNQKKKKKKEHQSSSGRR
jgi:hypothetical protein